MTCDFCGKDNLAVVMQGDRTFVCGSAKCLLAAQQKVKVAAEPFTALIGSMVNAGRRRARNEQRSGAELYPKQQRARPDASRQDGEGSA